MRDRGTLSLAEVARPGKGGERTISVILIAIGVFAVLYLLVMMSS